MSLVAKVGFYLGIVKQSRSLPVYELKCERFVGYVREGPTLMGFTTLIALLAYS